MRRLRPPGLGGLYLLALLALGSASGLSIRPPPAAPGDPGDFVVLPVTLTPDAGEALPEQVSVQLTLPPDWTLVTPPDGVPVEDGAFLLSLHLPQDARAGEVPLDLNITTPDGRHAQASLGVKVTAHAALDLSLPASAAVDAGARLTLPLELHNLGNAPDTFIISVEGSAQPEQDRISLQPGQSGQVQLNYRNVHSGNSDLIIVTARSLNDPAQQQRRLLNFQVGSQQQATFGDRPSLGWQLHLAPEYDWQDGAGGLGGLASASLQGQLSDEVRLDARYSGAGAPVLGAPYQDLGLLSLAGDRWSVALLTQNGLSNADLNGDYDFGGFSVQGSVLRRQGLGSSYWALGAGVSTTSGFSVSAEHRFVDAGQNTFTAGWTHTLPGRLNSLTPSVTLSARQDAAGWNFGLSQGLLYQDQQLLGHETYRYDSRSNSQELNLELASRSLRPLGWSVSASAQLQGGQLSFGVGGQGSYFLNDTTRLTAQATLGSSGGFARAGIFHSWQYSWGQLYSDAALSYAGGFGYHLGAGGNTGLLSANASLDADPFGVSHAGLGAQYGGSGGLLLRARYDLFRGPISWTSSAYLSAEYQADRWFVNGFYQRVSDPSGLHNSYGGRAQLRVSPSVNLNVSGVRQDDRTTVRAGLDLNVAGAFATPQPVVQLFGGRRVGSLDLLTYLDANHNGVRDPGERGLPVSVLVDGHTYTTAADGHLSVELRPRAYTVALAPDASSSVFLPAQPPVTVPLHGHVRLDLPVQQAATVQGHVRLPDGSPVEGTPVVARGAGGNEVTASTDAQGYYRLGTLPFGNYSIESRADASRYVLPPAQTVELGEQRPLQSVDFQVQERRVEIPQQVGDIALQLTLPQNDLPPGASFTVRAHTSRVVERVDAQLADQSVALQSSDGQDWSGRLRVPPDARGGSQLVVTAHQGENVSSERGLLVVNEHLPLAALQLLPGYALPGQVVDATLSFYGQAAQLNLRGPDGQPVVSLSPGGDNLYTASFRAPDTAGVYLYHIEADGVVVGQAQITVLGKR